MVRLLQERLVTTITAIADSRYDHYAINALHNHTYYCCVHPVRTPMPQLSVKEIVDRIFTARQISSLDQTLLMSCQSITEEEHELINRVFRALQRGDLRISP